jgi:uncharacterized protein (TIGR03118 family)
MSRSSGSPWWVSDNHSGKSTLYNATGAAQALVVTIPAQENGATGSPSGTIYDGSGSFPIAAGAPALFLFCTEDGTIQGWNPNVNKTSSLIEWYTGDGSSYKGMTQAVVEGRHYLYVANFTKARIDVFGTNFQPITLPDGRFEDDDLPFGFAPFNVQLIGDNLYVAYALPDSEGGDSQFGAGLGVVDVFTTSGKLLHRLEDGMYMNSPWALTQAPGDFGIYSHDILVGMFGSGNIVAFDPVTGKFDGYLMDPSGNPLAIDGLWALSFGNNGSAGSSTVLYYTAGPNGEADGVLGTLTPVATDLVQGNDQ